MKQKHHNCGNFLAKINGRTLKDALKITKANHRFGKVEVTQWIDICPFCDAYALGIETTHPWPFLCADGVMRTAADFNHSTKNVNTEDLFFCGLGFSESALSSAIALIQLEDPSTGKVENLGRSITQTGSTDSSLEFSKSVCDWGKGQRVWGNLTKRNTPENLEKALSEWFQLAIQSSDDEGAIMQGTKINGLGISFASKHLRMLVPNRYAVLDDVLSKGLGFALNPKGYSLFMKNLKDFLNNFNLEINISTLESGIFSLVRQQVRSQ